MQCGTDRIIFLAIAREGRHRAGVPTLSTYLRMHSGKIAAEIIDRPGRAWKDCEWALDSLFAPLPLVHRWSWAAAHERSGSLFSFVALRDENGSCRSGFAFESQPSRALPSHRLLLVERFGIGTGGLSELDVDAGLAALAARAGRDKRVLRVTVQAFAHDSNSLLKTADALRRNGFVQVPTKRTYERTLMIDLSPSENAIMDGFHATARRHIRSVSKHPVDVARAEAESLGERLQLLLDETIDRTHGERQNLSWSALIELAVKQPHLSRISILKRTDRAGPESIVAFARACMHGDVAEYAQSGSTRMTDLKAPMTYALMWDLILWAKKNGARWFDMGGVTGGNAASGDPLGGISDFKRYFSRLEMEVGQQWELYPHPRRAAVARLISRSARTFARYAKQIGKFQKRWLKEPFF